MRVLILGGGGTLGAFSAGALRAIARSGWAPDAFIGSSAGSINLLRYLAEGADGPARFWSSLGWRSLVRDAVRHDLLRNGLLNPATFHAAVEDGVDFARMHGDGRLIGFIVVNLGTGKVRIRTNRSEAHAADLRAMARASYALPPLLPPVHVGGESFGDGGLLINAPLDKAIRLGATEIVYLCNVEVLPPEGFAARSTFASAKRYADIFFRRASNVGFADAEIRNGRFGHVPFLAIAPPSSLRLRSMVQWMLPTRGAMDHLVACGETCGARAIAATPWVNASIASRDSAEMQLQRS